MYINISMKAYLYVSSNHVYEHAKSYNYMQINYACKHLVLKITYSQTFNISYV